MLRKDCTVAERKVSLKRPATGREFRKRNSFLFILKHNIYFWKNIRKFVKTRNIQPFIIYKITERLRIYGKNEIYNQGRI